MLKTNSKKARFNVQKYISNYADFEGYGIKKPSNFKDLSKTILAIFRKEKRNLNAQDSFRDFEDWVSGLPSALDCCYYWNRSAVDDLGDILEESDEEKAKYTEEQAESMLTKLIYRELVKGSEE